MNIDQAISNVADRFRADMEDERTREALLCRAGRLNPEVFRETMVLTLSDTTTRRLVLPGYTHAPMGQLVQISELFGDDLFVITLMRVPGGWRVETRLHAVRVSEQIVRPIPEVQR